METIFVMIPAYRDPDLRLTLDSLFKNAANPHRVFVAIGAQYDEDIPMPSLEGLPMDQIRLLQIHPNARPGTYRLRHILNKLYAGEDYYLSIDSHTIMAKGWDEKLIWQLESQPEYKCVIQQSTEIAGADNREYTYMQMVPKIFTDPYGDEREEVGYQLLMTEFVPKKATDAFLPKIHYMYAGLFFTRGQFATEIRWGQYWQMDQEESFLSYETFMTGWTVRLLNTELIIDHNPDNYYQHVYKFNEKGQRLPELIDDWVPKNDWLPYVTPRIWNVYLYNTGPWKIVNAIREPGEFWHAINLTDFYMNQISGSEDVF